MSNHRQQEFDKIKASEVPDPKVLERQERMKELIRIKNRGK